MPYSGPTRKRYHFNLTPREMIRMRLALEAYMDGVNESRDSGTMSVDGHKRVIDDLESILRQVQSKDY